MENANEIAAVTAALISGKFLLLAAVVTACCSIGGIVVGAMLTGYWQRQQCKFPAKQAHISQTVSSHGQLLSLVPTSRSNNPHDFFEKCWAIRYDAQHSHVLDSRVETAIDRLDALRKSIEAQNKEWSLDDEFQKQCADLEDVIREAHKDAKESQRRHLGIR